jgi:hypothetical protein
MGERDLREKVDDDAGAAAQTLMACESRLAPKAVKLSATLTKLQ